MSEWVTKSVLKPFRSNAPSMPVIKFGSTSSDLSPDLRAWTFQRVDGVRRVSKDLYVTDLASFETLFSSFHSQLAFAGDLQSGNSESIWQLDIDFRNKISQVPITYNNTYRMTLCSMKIPNGYINATTPIAIQDGQPFPFKWGLALFTVDNRSDYNGNYLGIVTCKGIEDTQGNFGGNLNITLCNIYDAFGTDLPIPTDDEEENPDYPDPSGGGGYDPDPDPSSDPIDIPDDPPIGFSTSGLYNVYKISNRALLGLASELFQDVDINFDDTDTLEEILKAIGTLAKNGLNMIINNNLIQFVLDCHILPCSPTTGAVSNIDIGFREFTQTGQLVTSDYVTVNCGNLNLQEYYANYLDYMTKFDLVLPFIGTVPIAPEYIQNGSINVTYKFNVIDGSCIAFVKSTSSKSSLSDTVIGTYTGSCCVHLPITGQNYASLISDVLGGSLGTVTSLATGNVGGAVSNAMQVLSAKPNIQGSNGYSATSSILGMRTPYLIIKRPVASFSRGYTHDKGLPSNVYTKLSDLTGTGFATISKIDLSGINLLKEEKDELEQLLMEGVYF